MENLRKIYIFSKKIFSKNTKNPTQIKLFCEKSSKTHVFPYFVIKTSKKNPLYLRVDPLFSKNIYKNHQKFTKIHRFYGDAL